MKDMKTNEKKLSCVIELISKPMLKRSESKKLKALLSVEMVNKHVSGMPLISHYLKHCALLDIDVLRAFLEYKSNLNVQDEDGKTPLHWLIGHNFDSDIHKVRRPNVFDRDYKIKWVKLMLDNGANPTQADNDGNNVLMVAVICKLKENIIDMLTEEHDITRRLASHRNNWGHDALALYFRKEYYHPIVSGFSRLIEKCPFVKNLDNDGNSCLHNIFLRPVEQFKPTLHYSASDAVPKSGRCEYRKTGIATFSLTGRELDHVIDSLLAANLGKVTQKNKSGLIPLQVALSSDWKPYSLVDLANLRRLIPSEEFLKQLVPPPTSQFIASNPSDQSVQVWLAAYVVKNAHNYIGQDHVLSVALVSRYCSHENMVNLVSRGGKVSTNNLQLVIGKNVDCRTIELFFKGADKSVLSNFSTIKPNIGVSLIQCNRMDTYCQQELLKLVLDYVNDVELFKAAIGGKRFTLLSLLLDYLTSDIKIAIETQIPEILVTLLASQAKTMYIDCSLTFKLVTKMINKLNIDINHHDENNGFVLHNIIELYGENSLHNKWMDSIFDLVLKQSGVDVDKKIGIIVSKDGNAKRSRIELSPIKYAIRCKQFDLISKLILAGADCRELDLNVFDNESGINPTMKILYQIGYHFDICDIRSRMTTKVKRNEVDQLAQWIKEQPVKSLTELTAMAVRKNTNKIELVEIISAFELPAKLTGMLHLKHLTFEPLPEVIPTKVGRLCHLQSVLSAVEFAIAHVPIELNLAHSNA